MYSAFREKQQQSRWWWKRLDIIFLPVTLLCTVTTKCWERHSKGENSQVGHSTFANIGIVYFWEPPERKWAKSACWRLITISRRKTCWKNNEDKLVVEQYFWKHDEEGMKLIELSATIGSSSKLEGLLEVTKYFLVSGDGRRTPV